MAIMSSLVFAFFFFFFGFLLLSSGFNAYTILADDPDNLVDWQWHLLPVS